MPEDLKELAPQGQDRVEFPPCRTCDDPNTRGFDLCETDMAFPKFAVDRLHAKIFASWHDRFEDLDDHVIAAGRDGVVKVRIDLSSCGSPIGKMLCGLWEVSVTIRAINADCTWRCCIDKPFHLCSKTPYTDVFVEVPAWALRLCEPCAGTLYNVYVTVAAKDECGEYMPIVGYAEGGPVMVYRTLEDRPGAALATDSAAAVA